MPTRRTTILADADLLDRLDRLAHHERTTKTAVIGAAIEAWLDAHPRDAGLSYGYVLFTTRHPWAGSSR